MTKLESKKLELLEDYIKYEDFGEYVKSIKHIFENDVVIFDSSFRLRMTTLDDQTINEIINKINKNKSIKNMMIKKLKKDNIDKTLEANKPVIISLEQLDKSILVRKLHNDLYSFGYVCIYANEREIVDDDYELLTTLCDMLLHYYTIKGISKTFTQVIYMDIVKGMYNSEEEINSVLKNKGLKKFIPMRLMFIRTDKPKQILYMLANMDKEHYAFEFDGGVVSAIDEKIDEQFINEIIENNSEVKIGISEVIHNYMDVPKYYKHTIEVMDIGYKDDPNKNVFCFDDYRLPWVLAKEDENTIKKYLDKRILSIIEYDKNNNTTYYNDLKSYFESGRNINTAAKMINVHKNSLYYRLDKINELFNIDITNENDCFDSELSMKIIKIRN